MNIKIMHSVFTVGPHVTTNNAEHRVLHKNDLWLFYFAYNNEKYLCVYVEGMIFLFHFKQNSISLSDFHKKVTNIKFH